MKKDSTRQPTKLPNIRYKTIPHKEQRYDTCGDYWLTKKGDWEIRVSDMGEDYEFLVLVHELIEFYLTQKRGIAEEDITYFDTHEGKDSEEPGLMKYAPYHREHVFADKIERMVCKELGLDWDEYDKAISKLIF